MTVVSSTIKAATLAAAGQAGAGVKRRNHHRPGRGQESAAVPDDVGEFQARPQGEEHRYLEHQRNGLRAGVPGNHCAEVARRFHSEEVSVEHETDHRPVSPADSVSRRPVFPRSAGPRPGCVALKAGAHETPSQIS